MEDQKKRVYDALDKLKIKYEVVEHEPVHTMEDMDRLGLPEKGTLCKNLFLRDSKGKRHFIQLHDSIHLKCDRFICIDIFKFNLIGNFTIYIALYSIDRTISLNIQSIIIGS